MIIPRHSGGISSCARGLCFPQSQSPPHGAQVRPPSRCPACTRSNFHQHGRPSPTSAEDPLPQKLASCSGKKPESLRPRGRPAVISPPSSRPPHSLPNNQLLYPPLSLSVGTCLPPPERKHHKDSLSVFLPAFAPPCPASRRLSVSISIWGTRRLSGSGGQGVAADNATRGR